MMPGFIDRKTPSGLANFKHDSAQTKLGQRIAKSFTFVSCPEGQADIFGLYVMGSVGTIAQSASSDLDIWVCHTNELTPAQRQLLKHKGEKISAWALAQKLEVHFFLMNAETFRSGTLSTLDEESSGNAQKMLLLDEFYRSAICLGGKTPLWWQVPPSAEAHYYQYAQTVIRQRFVSEKTVMDFGGIASIPKSEFIGAGIWQLYKAINSPYKSILKLLLLEAYASSHPNILPISLKFKKLVYEGETDVNELDGYIIVYRYIENYLQNKKQLERLELVRRSFYFKVNIPLSDKPSARHRNWQGQLLQNLVSHWGWSQKTLRFLDNQKNWKASEVADERSLLVSELNHSYHFLINFDNHSHTSRDISSGEITVLGRKLQAAFERRPGKIEWINPGISKNISEPTIYLEQEKDNFNNQSLWSAVSIEKQQDSQTLDNYHTRNTLKTSSSVVETLLWCHFNKIINDNTNIELELQTVINRVEIKNIINHFNSWLKDKKSQVDHSAFEKKATPKKVLLLINSACKPFSDIQTEKYRRLSDKTDPLSYSGFERNLVNSIDIVIQNSWNEISTRRFDGEQCLTDGLEEYLQLCIPGSQHLPPTLTIECIGQTLHRPIAKRVRQWFEDIIHCFYADKNMSFPRYVFKMGKQHFCLQYHQSHFTTERFENMQTLIEHLSHTQIRPSDICIDNNTFAHHLLRAITQLQKSNKIQVFYYRLDIGLELYVLDEKNSLYHCQIKGNYNNKPLACLHQFLRIILNRSLTTDDEIFEKKITIGFYEVTKSNGHFLCHEKTLSSTAPTRSLFDVKAIAHQVNGKIAFDYYCDNQEFSAMSFGAQLELVVAQFIVARRGGNSHYPIHINDLDLSLCSKKISNNGFIQTIHYLKIKDMLEKKLNHAIGIIGTSG